MPAAFDCQLTVTMCVYVKPKPSSWRLISSLLSLHQIVDQCPVTEKPMQNAMIMSCQMPITGNSALWCVVDETVTRCQPSSASSLLFHVTFEELYCVCFPCVNVMILISFDLFNDCAAWNISNPTVTDITYCSSFIPHDSLMTPGITCKE